MSLCNCPLPSPESSPTRYEQGTFSVSYDTTEPGPPDPTRFTYLSLTAVYDILNERLFVGRLPRCLITYQRQRRSYGYFSQQRFGSRDGTEIVDEIALNPAHFAAQTFRETLQTLGHEMCHLEQHHFGKPSRRGYHNKEWGMLMERVGLMPSATGAPGGARTGQHMQDYVIDDSPFALVAAELEALGVDIRYVEIAASRHLGPGNAPAIGEHDPASGRNKIKYQCPGCGINTWGKPGLFLICGTCFSRWLQQHCNEIGPIGPLLLAATSGWTLGPSPLSASTAFVGDTEEELQMSSSKRSVQLVESSASPR